MNCLMCVTLLTAKEKYKYECEYCSQTFKDLQDQEKGTRDFKELAQTLRKEVEALRKDISELERKLKSSLGREEALLEYNHQILETKKRLNDKINGLEKLCSESIRWEDQVFELKQEVTELEMYKALYPELHAFIFDELKLGTLFHKLRKNK